MGQSIRGAITGKDQCMTTKYFEQGIPTLAFERNRIFASRIDPPTRDV
jgi:hypothetical protein